MSATDGLVRGMEVIDTGKPIAVPVGNKTLGSVSNKPKTGDTNSTLLWVIMGTMALGVMVVSGTTFVVKKRKNNKLS